MFKFCENIQQILCPNFFSKTYLSKEGLKIIYTATFKVLMRCIKQNNLLMLILSVIGKTADPFMTSFDKVDAASSCEYDD